MVEKYSASTPTGKTFTFKCLRLSQQSARCGLKLCFSNVSVACVYFFNMCMRCYECSIAGVLGSEFGQEFAQDCFIYCAVQLTKIGCVFSRLPDLMSCMKSLGLLQHSLIILIVRAVEYV